MQLHSKPGGCKNGSRFRFQHQEEENSRAGKTDCTFWMAGGCKYSEVECSKSHDPAKKGSKSKKKDDWTDFAGCLAQVLSQASGLEAPRGPAQGMEAQRWPAQGMGGLPGFHMQGAFQQPSGPPPPFQNLTPTQMTPPFQLAGALSDPTQMGQLILQAMQMAQAGRR